MLYTAVTPHLHAAFAQAYSQAIAAKLDDEGLITRCDEVIDVGNDDFANVYGSVYTKISNSEPEGMEAYRNAVEGARKKITGECKQVHLRRQMRRMDAQLIMRWLALAVLRRIARW